MANEIVLVYTSARHGSKLSGYLFGKKKLGEIPGISVRQKLIRANVIILAGRKSDDYPWLWPLPRPDGSRTEYGQAAEPGQTAISKG